MTPKGISKLQDAPANARKVLAYMTSAARFDGDTIDLDRTKCLKWCGYKNYDDVKRGINWLVSSGYFFSYGNDIFRINSEYISGADNIKPMEVENE